MTAEPKNDLRSLGNLTRPNGFDERDRPTASGLSAARPSVAMQRANTFYYATDTGVMSYTDGSTWTTVGGGGATTRTDVVISAANTDLAWTAGSAASVMTHVGTVGGTLRSIGIPTNGAGTRWILRNNAGGSLTLLNLTAGGSGQQLLLRTGNTRLDNYGDTIELVNDGSYWIETNIDPDVTGYNTTAIGTSIAITNGIWNQLSLSNGEWRDDGGWHSTSTNPARITTPYAGVYLIHGRVAPTGMTGSGPCEMRCSWYDSGSGVRDQAIAYTSDLNNLNSVLNATGVAPIVAANDYFTVEFQGNATGAGGSIGTAFLSVTLLKTP